MAFPSYADRDAVLICNIGVRMTAAQHQRLCRLAAALAVSPAGAMRALIDRLGDEDTRSDETARGQEVQRALG